MEEQIRRLRMESEFLKEPEPSSRGGGRSRALRPHRGGEGQLFGRVGAIPVLYLHDPEFHFTLQYAMAPGGAVEAVAAVRAKA